MIVLLLEVEALLGLALLPPSVPLRWALCTVATGLWADLVSWAPEDPRSVSLRSQIMMAPSLPAEARTFSLSGLYETDLMLAVWPPRATTSLCVSVVQILTTSSPPTVVKHSSSCDHVRSKIELSLAHHRDSGL